MKLIMGGAYQGKLDFAKNTLGIPEEDIFTCTGGEVDFSARCINAIEEFTYACACSGRDPVAVFRDNREAWKDSVLICQDLSSGVVPLGKELRIWRNENGRLCQYLAARAESVSRIFCGLEQRLK